MWIARALRAGTVASKEPPETVMLIGLVRRYSMRSRRSNTHVLPEQEPSDASPLITSQ